jgi:hypothetical protein
MEIQPNSISIEREFNIKKEKAVRRTSFFMQYYGRPYLETLLSKIE